MATVPGTIDVSYDPPAVAPEVAVRLRPHDASAVGLRPDDMFYGAKPAGSKRQAWSNPEFDRIAVQMTEIALEPFDAFDPLPYAGADEGAKDAATAQDAQMAAAAAWGDAAATQRLRWPLFVHARRKPGRW